MSLSGSSPHRGLRSSTNSITMHILVLSLWLTLALGVLFLCWQIVQSYQGGKVSKKSEIEGRQREYRIQELIRQGKERAKRQQRKAPKPQTRKSRRESADPRLWKQLMTMLHGDKAAATRLIEHERMRNPDKSEKWLLEKAIWQLQRDRR